MNRDLQKQLAQWEVEPELPAAFPRAVWARIAARQTLWERARAWFALPRYAPYAPQLALLLLLLTCSASVGHWQARAANRIAAAQAHYFKSINPLELP